MGDRGNEPHPLRMFGVGPQQVLDAAVGRRLLGYELNISASTDDAQDELVLTLVGTDATVQQVTVRAGFGSLVVTSPGIEAP